MDMILIPMGRDQPYSVTECQPELLYLAQKAWRKWQRRQQKQQASDGGAKPKASDA